MEKLTKNIALRHIDEIKTIKYDDEVAHSSEDALYKWFIECVSEGMYTEKEGIEIANIVIRAKDIEFARWCA